ncbi:hypothetical protein B0H65DRAFT_573271 [Neurospora tetraspora]|uniref:CAP20-virulence factor n=1 Tax=Neurospora tetraspora TaxID=94610 RepID=A0AAE0JES1_9PEZI|nr:hypothetical protein B0H65DRAFT_573271 [Neurospora tetraspora]
MTHQKKTKMSNSSRQVNGDVAHNSAVIEHLLGYPIVESSISTVKANPYGQRLLEVTEKVYQTFGAPFLGYLQGPYQYVSPYVQKADDLGDKTLSKLDEKFPIVKKPTDELVHDAQSIIQFPIRLGQSGKEHVLSTYNTELEKVGGQGLTAYYKAALTTALTLGTETYATAASFLNTQKENAKQQTANGQANN